MFDILTVLGGDYSSASLEVDWRGNYYLKLRPKGKGFWVDSIKKHPEDISSIEQVTEQNKMLIGRKLGLTLAGGLLFGPVGAVAGAVFGGRGKDVTFLCSFKDGTQLLASAPQKLYNKILTLWLKTQLENRSTADRKEGDSSET